MLTLIQSYAQAAAPHGKEQQEHAHDIPDAVRTSHNPRL